MGKLRKQLDIPKSDFIEYGKAFETPAPNDDVMLHAVFGTVISDFVREKKQSFPHWNGIPEIKVLTNMDGSYKVAWYAVVPFEDDSDLWNQ